jgi:hypothetical protein
MAKTEKQEATILPIQVRGTVSPYPIVVTVIWIIEIIFLVHVTFLSNVAFWLYQDKICIYTSLAGLYDTRVFIRE